MIFGVVVDTLLSVQFFDVEQRHIWSVARTLNCRVESRVSISRFKIVSEYRSGFILITSAMHPREQLSGLFLKFGPAL